MDTTIVQPGASPSIYTTGDHHGRHHDDHGRRFDAIDARADYRSIVDGHRALTNEVERFGTQNLASAARTNEIVQAGNCRTDSLVQAGFGDTSDRICASTKDITAALSAGFSAEALASCKLADAIGDSKLFSAVQFKDQVIEANKNAANTANLISTTAAAAQVLATTIGNAQSVQNTNYFNQTTVQVERVRAELDAKVAAGFAAAALLAFQNKADSDAKAAACCCELKALITAEGVAGRALQNEIEARRVQNELQRLQTQVTVLTGGVLGAVRAA